MSVTSRLIAGACIVACVTSIGHADDDTLEEIGDVLQIALPATAFTATLFEKDTNFEGSLQYGASFGTMLATQSGIKLVVDKTRPNRGEQSFPSGHTAAAFSGASFLQRR